MANARVPKPPSVLDASAPIPELVSRVREARGSVEAYAAARKRRRRKVTAIVIGVLWALLAAACVAEPEVYPGAIIFGLVGAGLIAGSVALMSSSAPSVGDRCLQERCDLAMALLQVLGLDAADDAPVTLRLDLQLPSAPEKRVREGKVDRWSVEHFVDQWMRLRGRLLDGSRFDLALTEKLQARERTQRSRSGKTKLKIKSKSVHVGSLFLKVKPERYPGLPYGHDAEVAEVRLPDGTSLVRLDVTRDTLAIVAAEAPIALRYQGVPVVPYQAHHLPASLFTSLYAILRRARAGAELPA